MTEAEFLQKHLPPNATSANEVLYDFDHKFELSLSTETLEGMLTDLLPFLRDARFGPDLYTAGFEACELTLSFLARAQHQETPLPNGDAADAVRAEGQRLVNASRGFSVLRNNDATKRVVRILWLLGVEGAEESE